MSTTTNPLRRRMMEDMRIRGIIHKTDDRGIQRHGNPGIMFHGGPSIMRGAAHTLMLYKSPSLEGAATQPRPPPARYPI